MRKLLACLTIASCLVACDKADGPPQLPAARIAPQSEVQDVTVCPDAACEAACAKVEADIQKHCPDAWVAGCFAGTAPKDYPCKLFLRAQTPAPAHRPEAAPAESIDGPDEVPAAKSESEGAIRIEGIMEDPGKMLPALMGGGEVPGLFEGKPRSKGSFGAPDKKSEGDEEDGPDAKPTPFGD